MRRLLLLALMAGALGACTARQPTSVESGPADDAAAPTAAAVPEAPAPADTEADRESAPPVEPTTDAAVKPEPASAADAKALAGAKQLLRSLTKVDGLAAMAELMSNDTAAATGWGIWALLSFPNISSTGSLAPNKELEAFAKRYGLNPPPAALMPGTSSFEGDLIRKEGRAFLKDVAKLWAKMSAGLPEGGLDPFSGWGEEMGERESPALSYTVINSKRVRVELPGNPNPLEARLEDGKWRLHQPGGYEELKERMQQGFGRSRPVRPPAGRGGPSGLPGQPDRR